MSWRVGAAGLPGRHRKLRLRREPRIGIRLDHGDAAVGPQPHVDTGVVAQFERLEHRDAPSAAAWRRSRRAALRRPPTSCRDTRAVPLPPLHLGAGNPRRAFGQLRQIELDDRAAPWACSLPRTPTYISRPSTYSSISTGESKLAWSQSIRSISSRIELTTALNSMPIDPSSRAGLTMTGNSRSCEKSRRPRYDRAKTGVWMPWNSRIFLATALSCAVEQAVRSRAGEALVDELEVGGDAVVGGVVAGERLGEVEDQIAVHARDRVEALDRSVEAVQGRGGGRACRARRRLRPRLLSCRGCASAAILSAGVESSSGSSHRS